MKSQISPEPPEESMSQEKSTNSVEISHFGGKICLHFKSTEFCFNFNQPYTHKFVPKLVLIKGE